MNLNKILHHKLNESNMRIEYKQITRSIILYDKSKGSLNIKGKIN